MSQNDGIIEKIVIENIESHKHTELRLKPGVNAIVGLSDAGKSATLRSVGLVFTNKGLTRSWWGGVSDVEITFSDGNIVSRQTDKKNKYFLFNETTDEEYEAFGRDKSERIPKDIADALNVDEINISRQMDPHFLLSSKAGDVARTLNKACNLQVIDLAVSNIRKKATQNAAAIKVADEAAGKLQEQVEAFGYLPLMEAAVERLEQLQVARNQSELESATLSALLEEMQSAEAEREEINAILTAESDVVAIFGAIGENERLAEEGLALSRLIDQTEADTVKSEDYEYLLDAGTEVDEALSLLETRNALVREISALSDVLQRTAGHTTDSKACAALIAAEKDFDAVFALMDEAKLVSTELTSLFSMIEQTTTLIDEKLRAHHAIANMELEFARQMPDHCPLCGEIQ